MTAEVETEEPIPPWLASGVLRAIREDAGRSDPARAERYAGADAERVRRAVDRADAILAAHRRSSDDDAVDVALARVALIVARGLIRPRTQESDGR